MRWRRGPEDRGYDLAQPNADPRGADPDGNERLAERDDQHQAVALREVRRVYLPARRSAQRGAEVRAYERSDPEPRARAVHEARDQDQGRAQQGHGAGGHGAEQFGVPAARKA